MSCLPPKVTPACCYPPSLHRHHYLDPSAHPDSLSSLCVFLLL